jgi:hypothetical protein
MRRSCATHNGVVGYAQTSQLALRYLQYQHTDIRSLSPGAVILLLTMHDLEGMRTFVCLPSSLVPYFTNYSINSHTELRTCMADKVCRCIASCG